METNSQRNQLEYNGKFFNKIFKKTLKKNKTFTNINNRHIAAMFLILKRKLKSIK